MRTSSLFFIVSTFGLGAAFVACGSSDSTSSTATTASTSSAGGETTATSTSTTSTTSTSTSTTASGGGMGGATATSTTSTMTGSGGVGGMGAGGAGGAPCMPTDVNGCTEATAEDHTGDNKVAIAFGGVNPGEAYAPPCIKVKVGTTVTFNGDFTFHPIQGGEVACGVPMADPNSPIKATTSGMTASFKMTAAGTFPYYCQVHYPFGMKGAIFVQ